MQKILVNKATAFKVTVHVSLLFINLEANMEYAQSHKWGHEFRVSGQAIRKKYPDYMYKHNQMLYDNMVKEYAAADRVRVLREAPAPSDEQANQVGAFGGQLGALQRAFNDYEESAFSVDKESVKSKKKEKKKKKKKKDKDSRRGRTKHRSKLCGRRKSTDNRKATNKCKHCKKNRPHAGKHDKKNVSTTKSTKDGVPAKSARNWESPSNANKTTLQPLADLRAVYQETATVTGTVTVAQPATNDGVEARRMKNG